MVAFYSSHITVSLFAGFSSKTRMISALSTLFVGASLLLCFYIYLKQTHWKRNGIPTAKGFYPIIGHILSMIFCNSVYTDMIEQAYNDYKDSSMVGFYKGLKPVLIVRDTNLIKTVLEFDFSKFHRNSWKIDLDVDPLLGTSPFFTYGDLWWINRKRMAYAFSNSRLKGFFAVIKEVCTNFHAFLDKRLESNGKYEVELKYLFTKFTAQIVAHAGFSIDGLCFEDEDHPQAFDRIGQNLFIPGPFDNFITNWILLFPDLSGLLKIPFVPKELDHDFRKIIYKNLELRWKESTPRNDYLQFTIEIDKKNGKLDEDTLVAHAFSWYTDISQTSNITLSFVAYQLARHQDIQEKLRNEVMSTIEKHGGELTYDALKEMKYMEQVIMESQRYYSTANLIQKLCTEETVLKGSDGLTYRIKPGTEVIIPVSALQQDPKHWPDPEKFDPERFDEEKRQSMDKMTFLPFGAGPRMCPGKRMAMMQIKTCLATFLPSYKLELSEKMQLPLKCTAILFLRNVIGGLWATISRI